MPSPWPLFGGGGGGVASVTATSPLASSGGANPNISLLGWFGAPLSNVYVVDPGTTTPALKQNGSASSPFSGVAQALAAAATAALTEIAIALVPGTYPAEALVPTIDTIEIQCIGGGYADLSACTWNQAVGASFRIQSRNVCLPSLVLTSGVATLGFVSETFDSGAEIAGIVASSGGIDATGLAAASLVQAEITSCNITGQLSGSSIIAVLRKAIALAALSVAVVTVWDTGIRANLTWVAAGLDAELYHCTFVGGLTVTGPGAPSRLLMDYTSAHFAEQFGVTFVTAPIVSTDAIFSTTAARPVLDAAATGFSDFDTDLNEPVWWNGSAWVGASSTGGKVYYGTFASRPAAGLSGSRMACSDGSTQFVDDGSIWRPYINGKAGLTPPLVAAWDTAFGTITPTDSAGSVVFESPGGGAQVLSGVTMNLAAATDYTVTCYIRGEFEAANGDTGLVIRDSVSGDCQFFGIHGDGYSGRWMRATYVGGGQNATNFGAVPFGEGVWFRIVSVFAVGDSYQLSADGETWIEVVNVAAGARPVNTPDGVGICIADDLKCSSMFSSFEYT